MTQTTSYAERLAAEFPDIVPVNAIHPEIAALTVPVTSLHTHPDNPRIGNVEDIAFSLWRYGQYKPIVVQASTGVIIAGNHTWQAAQLLGWPAIAAARPDVDDETATRILLADNRLGDLASYDDAALVDLLRDLPDMAGTGYSEHDLDILLARMSTDLPDGFKPADPDDPDDNPDDDEDEDEGRGRVNPDARDGREPLHTPPAGLIRCPECRHQFTPPAQALR